MYIFHQFLKWGYLLSPLVRAETNFSKSSCRLSLRKQTQCDLLPVCVPVRNAAAEAISVDLT